MPLTRISITVPKPLVAAADRRARQLDRSRSWVVAEALRGYLGSGPAILREPAVPYEASAQVAAARRRHLLDDLRLSPEERLRATDELVRLSRLVREPRPRRAQVIGFDSYDDFYEWKKAQAAR